MPSPTVHRFALVATLGSSAAAFDDASIAPGESSVPMASSPRRQIIIDPDLAPTREDGIRARAVVDIEADPTVVRDQILDLEARVQEGWLVDSVEVYVDDVTRDRIHRRAKWSLSIFGFDIVYSTVYQWSRKDSKIVWSLDPTRDNDLTHAEGVYELHPRRDGRATHLVYVVEVGTKHSATKPIKKSLTVRNIRKLLESVRRRSERVR